LGSTTRKIFYFSGILAGTKELKHVLKSVSIALDIFVSTHMFTELIFKMLVFEVIWLFKFLLGHRSRGCVLVGTIIVFVMMYDATFVGVSWPSVACST
jgi:hypothetical protein